MLFVGGNGPLFVLGWEREGMVQESFILVNNRKEPSGCCRRMKAIRQ